MTASGAWRRLAAVPLALRLLGALLLLERRLRRWDVARVARRYDLPLLASAGPASGDLDPGTLDAAEVRRLRVLRRVLRLPGVNGTCLRSAILAGRVLRHRRPELVLGVAKTSGVVRAHAWLRVDGRDLDLDRGAGFRPLAVPTQGA
ncbi:lasso peptide biosynthesis B2 protein [Isoptericola sp. NPDC019693]|uniref:lasso peptide biosynthesis B2 protein n=1 Tax=Isoptericola sp. NPDC019693 TaxID=3364009 RepID=UPI00379215E7